MTNDAAYSDKALKAATLSYFIVLILIHRTFSRIIVTLYLDAILLIA